MAISSARSPGFVEGKVLMTDSFDRTLDYLRVSVTDRCNLRCVYCMPEEGVEWKPHGNMLTFEETTRICRVMAALGIRKVKVTGGEPLVRRGVASFVKELKAIPGIEKVTLTTNGFLLGTYLSEAAALSPASFPDGVNISLDALDSGRFMRITRTEGVLPEDILPHVGSLLEKRIQVKINCVPVRGFNEEEIVPLAGLAKDKEIAVRFIELMPLGSAAGFRPITFAETAALLEKAYGVLTPIAGTGLIIPIEGSGPAVYFSLPGFKGKIGFINPVSHGFCETCNRLRLTSEGQLRPCLSSVYAVDLRALLRGGASDDEIASAVKEAVSKKPAFHTLSPVYGAAPEETGKRHMDGMFGIGG